MPVKATTTPDFSHIKNYYGKKPHLSTSEVAELLGLKPNTMEIWRCQGRGPVFKKFGRAVRYSIDDLITWIDEQTRSNTCKSITGK